MPTRSIVRKGVASVIALLIILCALLGRAGVTSAQTQTAVEYYYAAWNMYFVTSFPNEIAILDGGAFGGVWQRTGQTFEVWTQPVNGALPTYRFFSVSFAPKSSHFYSPYPSELASLMSNPNWQLEAIAFYVLLPDANGNCPDGTDVLYRLYNNGMGGAPNHRFVRSVAQFNQMRLAGWIFEGNGLTGAYACVPSSPPPPPTAEGLWSGLTSDNRNITGVILDTGAYYFFYTYPSSNDIAAMLSGNGSSVDGVFHSSDGFDHGSGSPVTVTSNYVARTTLNGSVNESFASFGFNTSYQTAYEQPVALSTVVGTYPGSPFTVTIDATGMVTGSGTATNGAQCPFTGMAVPRGGVGVLNLTITPNGVGCPNTLTGIAYYDTTDDKIFIAATNSAHQYFWFVEQKAPVP